MCKHPFSDKPVSYDANYYSSVSLLTALLARSLLTQLEEVEEPGGFTELRLDAQFLKARHELCAVYRVYTMGSKVNKTLTLTWGPETRLYRTFFMVINKLPTDKLA